MFQLEESTYYNLKDISDKMGIGVLTLRKYVRIGKLKAHKAGRKYLVTGQEVKRYLDSQLIDNSKAK